MLNTFGNKDLLLIQLQRKLFEFQIQNLMKTQILYPSYEIITQENLTDCLGIKQDILVCSSAKKIVAKSRGANILESTWVFKKKRYPDDGLQIFKAHFCVWGINKWMV